MIDIRNVTKTYRTKTGSVEALRGVSLSVERAEIYGIIGTSGAGKSTLVRCINLLERPDSGEVFFDGKDMTRLPEKELRQERQKIGMIFQHFNLLRSMTVFENVAFPLVHNHFPKEEIRGKVLGLLDTVGLTAKAEAYPSQLSGGEKQRVGIARALASDPEALLSDEATSALDPETTRSILRLLRDLNEKLGLTIVLITHEMAVIKETCAKVAVIEKGLIIERGDTLEIFSRPRQESTRRFIADVFQADKARELLKDEKIASLLGRNGRVAHLVFTGPTANRAYISELSRSFNVDVNVFFGNIEIIQDSPIGSLYAVLNGEAADIAAATEYLESQKVQVQGLETP